MTMSLHNTFILPIGAALPTSRLEKNKDNAMWMIAHGHTYNNRRDAVNLCYQAGIVLGELANQIKESKKPC